MPSYKGGFKPYPLKASPRLKGSGKYSPGKSSAPDKKPLKPSSHKAPKKYAGGFKAAKMTHKPV